MFCGKESGPRERLLFSGRVLQLAFGAALYGTTVMQEGWREDEGGGGEGLTDMAWRTSSGWRACLMRSTLLRVLPEEPYIIRNLLFGKRRTLLQAPARLTWPSTKWMPHSVLSSSAHLPALGCSSSCTGLVCGSQPMLL